MPKFRLSVAAVFALTAFACFADQGGAERSPTVSGDQSPVLDGQRAYIDPVTGLLVTPPSGGSLSNKRVLSDKQSKMQRLEHSDGTIELRPNNPARHMIEAQLNDDGELEFMEADHAN